MNATNSNHSWCQTDLFTRLEDRTEIVRRVTLVKHRLIFDLLAASGNPISTNGILNHITVLLQQPTIVLLYKSSADGNSAEWVQHFDFNKTKNSRGSLELKGLNRQILEMPENVKLRNGQNDGLFRVYGSRFFLRVFLLETQELNDGLFVELSNKPYVVKKIGKNDSERDKKEYCRLCLSGLLIFDLDDQSNFGIEFLDGIIEKVEDVFLEQVYEIPPDDRRSRTLLRADQKKAKKAVETYFSNALGSDHGLDRIYTRAKFASKAIKTIGRSGAISKSVHGDDILPNIFFSLRAYDRLEPRCVRKLPNGGGIFHGYAHNISFAIPYHQKDSIIKHFLAIAERGEGGYIDERYGGEWEFSHEGYKNFAKSLDKLFWHILERRGRQIPFLLNTLISKVGSSSTSVVDPVFYYGSALYRMPFRRDGGLDRLYGLREIFDSLPDVEKPLFSISHLKHGKHLELRRDCLRVVIFFYLTRMLGPALARKSGYWTKLIIFPLDVSGAVVGTIGCVSFEPKIEFDEGRSRPVELPSESGFWNQEFYFFSEIVSSAQRVLRQQYRDFQIKQISIVFGKALNDLILKTIENDGFTKKSMVENLIGVMNSESVAVARACPYPRYVFDWGLQVRDLDRIRKGARISSDNNSQFKAEKNINDLAQGGDQAIEPIYIDIGTKIRLIADISKREEVFRGYYTTPGFSKVLRENLYSLKAKLEETVKMVLEEKRAATSSDES